MVAQSFFVLLFVPLLTYGQDIDLLFNWVQGNNCPAEKGKVTDSICCQDEKFCSSFKTEDSCTKDAEASKYCSWQTDACAPHEDVKSDVCCIGNTELNACDSMMRLECPKDFQTDPSCCSSSNAKYMFLKTDEGKVCCNAPCSEMEKTNCTNLPTKCAPTQRSWAMRNPHNGLGFGYHGPHGHKFGHIIHGTGFGHDLGYGYHHKRHGHRHEYEEHDHYDSSKDDHVDEITIDDMFLLMIDGLEKQTDVKIFDADITSDPYLGKKKSGGLFVDHYLPHADRYFDRIYGDEGHYDYEFRPFESTYTEYPGTSYGPAPYYESFRQPHYQTSPYTHYNHQLEHYAHQPYVPGYKPHW